MRTKVIMAVVAYLILIVGILIGRAQPTEPVQASVQSPKVADQGNQPVAAPLAPTTVWYCTFNPPYGMPVTKLVWASEPISNSMDDLSFDGATINGKVYRYYGRSAALMLCSNELDTAILTTTELALTRSEHIKAYMEAKKLIAAGELDQALATMNQALPH